VRAADATPGTHNRKENTKVTSTTTVAVERIHVPDNVRPLDDEHVKALAASIGLQGMLVPVVVCPGDDELAAAGFECKLVAGFHRLAAARELGLGEVPAVTRDAELAASDQAVENITRLALRADEEAVAVKAMLDRGLSEEGTAQALGWPKARVTARVKLLELPEQAQQLVGAGVIPLSAVDQLRTVGAVSSELLELLVAYLGDGHDEHQWRAAELVSDPGRMLARALRDTGSTVFATYLNQLPLHAVDELRLGKKATAQLAEAERLHKQINEYAYGPPQVRFADVDVDHARAAGVLIEFEHSEPIIVDESLYRELSKQALQRTVEQLQGDAERTQAEREQAIKQRRSAPTDPVEEARKEHVRRIRELGEQAHGANLDLGRALMDKLATVDPSDMRVARFFVFALLGADHDASPYTQSGELIAGLAIRGVRLVIEEFRTDVTKTKKDGNRGVLRIDYGDPKQPEKPIEWLWKFIDGAKTAGELYGRALVVIAAERHACRIVLPASQRMGAKPWPSHKGHATKALQKLAGPQLPATLKQLERAIARADREYETAGARCAEEGAAATEEWESDVDRAVSGEPSDQDIVGAP
jgi:ParB/RepB/Spo0J family partition protein